MGLSTGNQIKWWGLLAVAVILFLWMFSSILLPFIAGAAIAYFLDPVADRLERMGMPRAMATSIISLIAILVVIFILLLIVPLIAEQLVGLFQSAPDYVARLQVYLGEKFPGLFIEDSRIRQSLSSFEGMLKDQGVVFINGVLSGSMAIFDFMLILFITPVVAFYLLLDWDKLVATVDGWMPRQHLEEIRKIAREIDAVLAGFVRGQLTVSLILGSFYSICLMLIGLQYGLVVGLIAGILTFIPYVGTMVGGALSIGLAIYQFWDNPVWIAVVGLVFVVGQMVEGNFLTPKLVGGSVGLHPVWLIFSLSAFAVLMGFAGMLIAVPVAASIGVLGRYFMGKYMEAGLYRGPDLPEDE
ncbi:MAG: AI-2E family transporter [Rhodobacteraceae bacterium]|nr:AI-2E family transporter [Paracoccaceae bacterium]